MPFDPSAISAPFRMQPGLRRLGAGAVQVHANRLGDAHLAAKLDVLQAHAGLALCATAGWDAAPALHALCRQAQCDVPEAWRATAQGGWEACLLGWSVHGDQASGDGPEAIGQRLRALPAPWRLTALLALALREDLAVIDGTSGTIPWLAVCLPSHWAPTEKVGRHFAEVHAPVADNSLLLQASASLARLVTGTERWERFVWTVTPSPHLDAHPYRQPPVDWPQGCEGEAIAAHAWWRTERQTFIPVPAAGQAVFTIEVENRPLTAWLQQAPQAAAPLAAALASMSDAVLAYRGLAAVRTPLVEWLQGRAQAAQ